MKNDVFRGLGVKITLKNDDDFLKIKETLTRIGFASKKDNTLYQSCHILHKQGEYAIIHFKELFVLDGKTSDLNENDIARRNSIATLLQEWNLLSIVEGQDVALKAAMNQIKIIPFKEKKNWNLVSKYTIGNK
jgi:hypothetical protein